MEAWYPVNHNSQRLTCKTYVYSGHRKWLKQGFVASFLIANCGILYPRWYIKHRMRSITKFYPHRASLVTMFFQIKKERYNILSLFIQLIHIANQLISLVQVCDGYDLLSADSQRVTHFRCFMAKTRNWLTTYQHFFLFLLLGTWNFDWSSST